MTTLRSSLSGLLLFGIAATLRAAAPESLAGRVFYQSGITSTVGLRAYGASAYVLEANGRYRKLYSFGWDITRASGGWGEAEAAGYTYARTGTNTAELTLEHPGFAPSRHRLIFESERHGTVEPPPLVARNFTFWLGGGASPAPLTNVSLRASAGGGATSIAGFVITGPTPRAVLVRAVGPGLSAFGVTGFLADPKLSVPKAGPPLDVGDQWQEHGATDAIRAVESVTGAFPLATGSADAALILPALSPGAYTVHVDSATAGQAGEVLIEVYLLP